jgi:hypothetical protein
LRDALGQRVGIDRVEQSRGERRRKELEARSAAGFDPPQRKTLAAERRLRRSLPRNCGGEGVPGGWWSTAHDIYAMQ